MSTNRTIAIASRIIRQVLKDHRSVVLVFVAPIVVMSLVGFSFMDQPGVLNKVAPALIGVFAFFFTFILTGVSFLRERSQGTLERLLSTPVGRGDILVGYLVGFTVFASIQSLVILLYTLLVLPVEHQGSLWQIFLLLIVLTVAAVSLGIFVSTFANNEFQVVQFIPLVFAPQVFLSGIFLPIANMPGSLQVIARLLPLTYAVDGLRRIMIRGDGLDDVLQELGVLVIFAVIMLALAATTIRRT